MIVMQPLVYVVKVEQSIKKEIFDYLMQFVCADKKERILKQRIKQNADNILIGEILAKIAVKKNFGIDLATQSFVDGEYGKPYLLGYPDIHFNISHSGKYVACVVNNTPVGVDIQQIVGYNADIAQRVCSKTELDYIEQSNDKSSAFTKLWTQKEAVLKMQGIGIANADVKSCLTNANLQCTKIEDCWLTVATVFSM